jgi:hypothetical protein
LTANLLVLFVHAFDQVPTTHPDGITSGGDRELISRSGNPTLNGPTAVRDPEVSMDPRVTINRNSRENVTGHEVGHYLGSQHSTWNTDLMLETADVDHPNPCRIRKREWDRINPQGSTQ